jgi:hypothetical protein
MDAMQIISEMDAHIRVCGGKNSDWYFGVAADAMTRLFNEHRVDPYSSWIFRIADDAGIARMVAAAYHKVGCDGVIDTEAGSALAVYAYQKTPKTVP